MKAKSEAARIAAARELLDRGAVSVGPPKARGRQQRGDARQAQNEQGEKEDSELDQENTFGGNFGQR